MIWAILSILSGFGDAVAFASIKKLNNLNPYFVLGLRHIAALPFLLIGFLFYEIPDVTMGFYVVTLINVAVLLIAMLLLIKSLSMSDLSLSVPMLSFTPAFLLFTSYVMLNEYPNLMGFMGIIVTVIGSYIINIKHITKGYLEPFKKMLSDKGTFYMLIVAFLFSITSNLVKIGINMSNPAYFIFVDYLLASIILLPVFLKEPKYTMKISKNLKWIFVLAVSTAAMELLISVAVKLAIIPYVLSLKRTSVIFSVILGFLLFREKNFNNALIGSAIMFAGALLIMLS